MILAGDALRELAREALDPEPLPEDFGPMSVDIYAAIDRPKIIESGEHWVVPAAQDIRVPTNLGVMITGRSGHMRDGLFMPAGWLDPGFESDRAAGSPLKLEFGNTSDGAGLVEPDEPAARLTFFQLDRDTDGYDGRWGV